MKSLSAVLSAVLSVILVVTSSLHAGPIPDAAHPVSIGELRNQVSAQTAERAGNIREVQTLLRHQEVQDRLGHLLELEKLAAAVPKLDDETLARLARESKQMNEQFKAGISKSTIAVVVLIAVAIVVVYGLFAGKDYTKFI